MKKLTNGVAIPSFNPLSTLSVRRTPEGTRSSDMIDAPKAASVGATMAPMAAATQSPLLPNNKAAVAAPAAIVKGSPIPNNRAGIAASARTARRFTRDASAKSTMASVISASERIVDECSVKCTNAVGPCVTITPSTTKAMGAETSQRSSRPETIPHTMTQAEITVSAAKPDPWPMAVTFSEQAAASGQGRRSRTPHPSAGLRDTARTGAKGTRAPARELTTRRSHAGVDGLPDTRFFPDNAVLLPFLHLDLAAGHGLLRYLPQPRLGRRSQGPVGHLHHHPPVPRRLRVPDRPRRQDARAPSPTSGGPAEGVRFLCARGRRHARRRHRLPTLEARRPQEPGRAHRGGVPVGEVQAPQRLAAGLPTPRSCVASSPGNTLR